MNDPLSTPPSLTDRSGVTDAVRTQILATEHWSLLATRGMTWNEVFSRASMFITVLSAAVVALALVAQATAFGPGFRLFALLLLPVVLLVGFATVIRLGNANMDDYGFVIGMNRLRHAYLELAPELEPYFVTAQYDDEASILRSYGLSYHAGIGRFLSGTPNVVGAINTVLAGVLAALIAQTLAAPDVQAVAIGVVVAVAAAAGQGVLAARMIAYGHGTHRPRFPR
jgi:hypothetical protein